MAGPWRFNPCDSCCSGPAECESLTGVSLCSFNDSDTPRTIPDEMLVDLGSAFWADDDCAYCDQIAGQYTLTLQAAGFYSNCEWKYEASSVCTTSGNDADLEITLRIVALGTGWGWQLTLNLQSALLIYDQAIYRTAIGDATSSTSCWEFGGEGALDKIQLPLHSQSSIGSLCDHAAVNDPVDVWTTWTEA